MEIATPDRSKFLLPEGTREVKFAEHQPEYETLPALVTPDGRLACQWTPTPGEIELLNRGVPVTLVVWTFNRPLQPVSLMVGGADLR
jgi:hypothetical protein